MAERLYPHNPLDAQRSSFPCGFRQRGKNFTGSETLMTLQMTTKAAPTEPLRLFPPDPKPSRLSAQRRLNSPLISSLRPYSSQSSALQVAVLLPTKSPRTTREHTQKERRSGSSGIMPHETSAEVIENVSAPEAEERPLMRRARALLSSSQRCPTPLSGGFYRKR